MALEFGSGTQADPYLLVNLADVDAFVKTKIDSGQWFALTADLDVSTSIINISGWSAKSWKFNLDGRGFKLFLKVNYYFGGIYDSILKSAHLQVATTHSVLFANNPAGTIILNNSIVEFKNSLSGATRTAVSGVNGLLIESTTYFGVKSGSVNIYKVGGVTSNTINVNSFVDGNPYNKDNYVGLNDLYWIFDGLSLPRPRPQATADITNRYGVKGQSKVGGNGRQRNLAVFTENGLRYKVQDTKADGSFFLNLNDVTTPVIVLAYDDIGAKAVINTAYSLNQIIHPATPNGFRYRCTLAGNSGATIPPEPWSTTTVLTIGAAKFTPEPVYEPKAHGPLLPVLFNVITEQPV
ncbi:hypothetical protein JGK42_002281 [Aeromonas veronii]|nr:hypothetical protein [Aeromonas veronii]